MTTETDRPSIEDVGDARLPARFWAKVKLGPVPAHRPDLGPCWEWTAYRDDKGYGIFRWEGHTHRAHRVAYQVLVGPLPEGLESDHLCRNRPCVRPFHIELVTHRVNLRRGDGAIVNRALQLAKTHCPQGHPLSGDNLYLYRFRPKDVVGDGMGRHCKACRHEAVRRYRVAQRLSL